MGRSVVSIGTYFCVGQRTGIEVQLSTENSSSLSLQRVQGLPGDGGIWCLCPREAVAQEGRGICTHIPGWEAEADITSEPGRFQRYWPAEAGGAAPQGRRLPRKETRK